MSIYNLFYSKKIFENNLSGFNNLLNLKNLGIIILNSSLKIGIIYKQNITIIIIKKGDKLKLKKNLIFLIRLKAKLPFL